MELESKFRSCVCMRKQHIQYILDMCFLLGYMCSPLKSHSMKNSAGLSKIFLRVYYSLKYMNTQRTKQRVTFSAEYAKLLLLLASCLSTQKKKIIIWNYFRNQLTLQSFKSLKPRIPS